MPARRPASVVALAAALVAAAPAVAATDADRAARPEWRRALNGHLFLPSLIAGEPFVPTAFTLSTGGGIADVRAPAPELGGYRFGDGAYRLGALAEAIGFQAGITRWLGVRLFGVADGFGGVGLDAAAAVGGTLSYATRFGLTVTTPLGRFARLGLLTDVEWRQARAVIPLDGLARTLLAGRADAFTIDTTTRTAVALLPGVSLALAPHAALGLVATAQVGWERIDDGAARTDGGRALLSVALDLDLRALTRALPLGLLGAYRAQLPFSSPERDVHDVEGGLFYTGRPALALGVVARARWFELRPGLDATAVGGAVHVRTFFR